MGNPGNQVHKEVKEGERYGKLTALAYIGNKGGYRKWRCRCDCGNITEVQENHLKSGHTKSCGCLKRDVLKSKAYDLTGKVFGRLTVLQPAEEGYWVCRCECGKECTVYKENLTRGNTKSCGCFREEIRKKNMKKAIHFVDDTCVEKIASKKLNANNTTGHTGVCRIGNGRYRSFIGFKNKKYSIGTYSSIEEAVEARKKKEEELFGSFLEEYYSAKEEQIKIGDS